MRGWGWRRRVYGWAPRGTDLARLLDGGRSTTSTTLARKAEGARCGRNRVRRFAHGRPKARRATCGEGGGPRRCSRCRRRPSPGEDSPLYGRSTQSTQSTESTKSGFPFHSFGDPGEDKRRPAEKRNGRPRGPPVLLDESRRFDFRFSATRWSRGVFKPVAPRAQGARGAGDFYFLAMPASLV